MDLIELVKRAEAMRDKLKGRNCAGSESPPQFAPDAERSGSKQSGRKAKR